MTMLQEVIPMPFTKPTEFAEIARVLQAECHRLMIHCPAMRTPPRTREARTIRRHPEGIVVAVRLDRDPHAVTSDLIDGILAAQGDLDRDAVELLRGSLWEAAGMALAA